MAPFVSPLCFVARLFFHSRRELLLTAVMVQVLPGDYSEHASEAYRKTARRGLVACFQT
jgi:hypothetical protein